MMECNPIFKRQPVRSKPPIRQFLFAAVIATVFLLYWLGGKTVLFPEDYGNSGLRSRSAIRNFYPHWVQSAEADMRAIARLGKNAAVDTIVYSPGIPRAERDAGNTGETVDYGDLPRNVRESLRLDISMMVYSTRPGRSSIIINGVKTFEGQMVKAGLNLERITHEGAVFEYRGWRFRKGVGGR